jgi:hypothetical protein
MREILLTPLAEEPKILDDVTSTWSVESWRSMSKKEHGPVFQAGGYPWYARPEPLPPLLPSLTSFEQGVSYFSRTAITSINARYTWNTASSRAAFRKTGAAASTSRSSCGTRTIRAYTHIIKLTIALRRKRAIGASQDSLSCERCSMCRGKPAADPSARTRRRTSRLTSGLSRTRRVFCGTTSTTTIPKRRQATSV